MTPVRLLVVFFAAMAAQWLWMTHFALFGFAPQLLLVLTVALAARYGPAWAMASGFLWGLFLDVMSPRLFGANALAFTWIAYGTGSVRRQIDVAGLGPQTVVVFAMTWAYFLLQGVLGLVFAKSFYWAGWGAFLVDPLLNVFAAAAVYALWSPRWEHRR